MLYRLVEIQKVVVMLNLVVFPCRIIITIYNRQIAQHGMGCTSLKWSWVIWVSKSYSNKAFLLYFWILWGKALSAMSNNETRSHFQFLPWSTNVYLFYCALWSFLNLVRDPICFSTRITENLISDKWMCFYIDRLCSLKL